MDMMGGIPEALKRSGLISSRELRSFRHDRYTDRFVDWARLDLLVDKPSYIFMAPRKTALKSQGVR